MTGSAPVTIDHMRKRAMRGSLFAPVGLARAIGALGFVQADPIRAPARAQDLILRHRVADYRAGDLERRFARLGLEEDFLHVYGFMGPETARLVHPRQHPESPDGAYPPSGLAADVLEFVRANGPAHPQDLATRFGAERAPNGWGGFSKATTRALESLHYYGMLRVAHRRDGIRVYEAAPPRPEPLAPAERLRALVLVVARLLAPVSEQSLRSAVGAVTRRATGLRGGPSAVQALLRSGELESCEVDGERYLWPADMRVARTEAPRRVRFLAPFDPIVWDRRRFEHLWGWAYRFEAYTPPAKRQLGYYAMPLLWGQAVIGWANVTVIAGRLDVTAGFIGAPPSETAFRTAFDAEVARMEAFLALPER